MLKKITSSIVLCSYLLQITPVQAMTADEESAESSRSPLKEAAFLTERDPFEYRSDFPAPPIPPAESAIASSSTTTSARTSVDDEGILSPMGDLKNAAAKLAPIVEDPEESAASEDVQEATPQSINDTSSAGSPTSKSTLPSPDTPPREGDVYPGTSEGHRSSSSTGSKSSVDAAEVILELDENGADKQDAIKDLAKDPGFKISIEQLERDYDPRVRAMMDVVQQQMDHKNSKVKKIAIGIASVVVAWYASVLIGRIYNDSCEEFTGNQVEYFVPGAVIGTLNVSNLGPRVAKFFLDITNYSNKLYVVNRKNKLERGIHRFLPFLFQNEADIKYQGFLRTLVNFVSSVTSFMLKLVPAVQNRDLLAKLRKGAGWYKWGDSALVVGGYTLTQAQILYAAMQKMISSLVRAPWCMRIEAFFSSQDLPQFMIKKALVQRKRFQIVQRLEKQLDALVVMTERELDNFLAKNAADRIAYLTEGNDEQSDDEQNQDEILEQSSTAESGATHATRAHWVKGIASLSGVLGGYATYYIGRHMGDQFITFASPDMEEESQEQVRNGFGWGMVALKVGVQTIAARAMSSTLMGRFIGHDASGHGSHKNVRKASSAWALGFGTVRTFPTLVIGYKSLNPTSLSAAVLEYGSLACALIGDIAINFNKFNEDQDWAITTSYEQFRGDSYAVKRDKAMRFVDEMISICKDLPDKTLVMLHKHY